MRILGKKAVAAQALVTVRAVTDLAMTSGLENEVRRQTWKQGAPTLKF
jgi:hypothetical protein